MNSQDLTHKLTWNQYNAALNIWVRCEAPMFEEEIDRGISALQQDPTVRDITVDVLH